MQNGQAGPSGTADNRSLGDRRRNRHARRRPSLTLRACTSLRRENTTGRRHTSGDVWLTGTPPTPDGENRPMRRAPSFSRQPRELARGSTAREHRQRQQDLKEGGEPRSSYRSGIASSCSRLSIRGPAARLRTVSPARDRSWRSRRGIKRIRARAPATSRSPDPVRVLAGQWRRSTPPSAAEADRFRLPSVRRSGIPLPVPALTR